MITEELLKYIESERKAGKDDLRIREVLKSEGWSAEDLNEGFRKIVKNRIRNRYSKIFNRILIGLIIFSFYSLFFDGIQVIKVDPYYGESLDESSKYFNSYRNMFYLHYISVAVLCFYFAYQLYSDLSVALNKTKIICLIIFFFLLPILYFVSTSGPIPKFN